MWIVTHSILGHISYVESVEFVKTREESELGSYELPHAMHELQVKCCRESAKAQRFSELEARLMEKVLDHQQVLRVIREYDGNMDWLANFGTWEVFPLVE